MHIHNYNHLYYFYITAKLGGMTAAAEHLNTSQSSLSAQVKILEINFNKKLFKKSGRKIELTDFGREVYGYCRNAFDVFDQMSDQIFNKQHAKAARVSVGVSAEIERPYVTDVLSDVSRLYQKNDAPLLNLISENTKTLVEDLKLGDIDILLTTDAIVDSEIQLISDVSLPVGFFIQSEFKKIIKNSSLEKVINSGEIPMVLPAKGTVLRAEIDTYFNRKKIKPNCVFESNMLAAVIRAAIDGLGAAIVPLAFVERDLTDSKLINLFERSPWQHRITALASRGKLSEEKSDFMYKLISRLKK